MHELFNKAIARDSKLIGLMLVTATAAFWSGAAMAQMEQYSGIWCPQGDGEHMQVMENGIGFNEHTICDWKTGPDVTPEGFSGVLTCRNVYVADVSEDGTVSVVETEHRNGVTIVATRLDAGLLSVITDGEQIEPMLGPCG